MRYRKLIRNLECEKCGLCKIAVSVFEANEDFRNQIKVSERYDFWIPKEEIEIMKNNIKCQNGHDMSIDWCISEWI